MVTWLIFGLLIPTLVIRLVGAVSRSFQVRDLGAAFTLACAVLAVAWVVETPLLDATPAILQFVLGSSDPSQHMRYGRYLVIGSEFVVNSMLFLVLGLFVPGVTVDGVLGVFIAAVLIAVVSGLTPFLMVLAG